jgi:hypothetical protein
MKRKHLAYILVAVALALLAVTVWLFLDHHPPMGHPGPPPERPELLQDSPGGPPPEPFFEETPDRRPPLRPETKMALGGILAVLMTLCAVAAVSLLRKPKATPDPLPVPEPEAPVQVQKDAPTTISFKSDYKTVTIQLDDIRYIESMSEYVKIYLDSQADPLMVLYSLKRLVEELPADKFMRIHRSYIIALNRIRQANASSVVLETPATTLPVGESYRPAFRKFLAEK